jgi:phosphate transport system substrate-binding protein
MAVRGKRQFAGWRFLPVLAAAMSLALGSCSGSSVNATEAGFPPGNIVLRGAGATFPSSLYSQWFTTYHDEYPSVYIEYSSVGSGEGVRRFIGKNLTENETVDFAASDSAMQDGERSQVPDDALLVPITGGCVGLAYNLPHISGTLKLSRAAYAGIFLGEIKNWNDPRIVQSNPGMNLSDLTIVTVVRQDSSGTTYDFIRNLDAVSDRWRSLHGPVTLIDWPGIAMRATGNEGVAGLIEKSVGSIGYVGFELAQRISLPMAALENKEGKYVEPSGESCSIALSSVQLPDSMRAYVPDPVGQQAYPIVTFSWALLHEKYPDKRTAAAVRDLFRWCLLDGQKYASALGYVPLPSPVTEKAIVAINNVH